MAMVPMPLVTELPWGPAGCAKRFTINLRYVLLNVKIFAGPLAQGVLDPA